LVTDTKKGGAAYYQVFQKMRLVELESAVYVVASNVALTFTKPLLKLGCCLICWNTLQQAPQPL
jgi:hypothetical protein